MARSHAATVLAALLFATCSVPPTASMAGMAALARYDELCRFLPPDMQSYWFSDWPRGHRIPNLEGEPRLIARAASDFRSPPHIGAVGQQASVEATDFGVMRKMVFEAERTENWTAQTPINGHPVWCTPSGTTPETPNWIAFVDERYQVTATSHKLLVRALARTSDRQLLLAFVPDLSVLANNPTDVIFCRPRPQPKTAMAGPSPTSILIAQVHYDECRVEVFATERQRLIETHYGNSNSNSPAVREAVQRGSYYVFDMTFSESDSWILHLMLLFGTHVAI